MATPSDSKTNAAMPETEPSRRPVCPVSVEVERTALDTEARARDAIRRGHREIENMLRRRAPRSPLSASSLASPTIAPRRPRRDHDRVADRAHPPIGRPD